MKHHVARLVFGLIGNVISIILFLLPMNIYVNIVKTESVDNVLPEIPLIKWLYCSIWLLYGIPKFHPGRWLLIPCYGLGVLIHSIYVVVFVLYVQPGVRKFKLILIIAIEIVSVVALAIILVVVAHTSQTRAYLFGASVYTATVFVSEITLSMMREGNAGSNLDRITFWTCLLSAANGLIWALYGVFPFESMIFWPNAMSFCLALVQLAIWCCKCQQSSEAEANSTPTIGELCCTLPNPCSCLTLSNLGSCITLPNPGSWCFKSRESSTMEPNLDRTVPSTNNVQSAMVTNPEINEGE